jgi:hypothetical protein
MYNHTFNLVMFCDTDEQSGAAVGFKIKQEILKF